MGSWDVVIVEISTCRFIGNAIIVGNYVIMSGLGITAVIATEEVSILDGPYQLYGINIPGKAWLY